MTSDIYTSADAAQVIERRYRDFLRHWPVPSEHLRVPTREGETFVVASGPAGAPPVVLLHGSSANAASWMGDIPVWADHFRVYAVDMIGEPGLSAPSRPPLGSEAYALWLDDVFAALGLARAAVVGVSLGGWLALDYATRRPARVDGLALLCPGGLGRQKYGVLLLAAALTRFGRWGMRTTLRIVLGVEPPPTPEAQEFGEYMMLVTEHFRPRRVALPRFDDDALRHLEEVPVLAIVGGRDRMLDSAGTRRRLERALPGAVVRVLPDAGHLLLDQAEPVRDFLLSSCRR